MSSQVFDNFFLCYVFKTKYIIFNVSKVQSSNKNRWFNFQFIRNFWLKKKEKEQINETITSQNASEKSAKTVKSENEREGWDNPYQFFLASLGYASK